MSDRDRMLQLLRDRGPRGATTLEMRRMGLSGNPSQRRSELLDRGYRIDVKPHREGRRNGRLYVLVSEPAEVGTVTTHREGAGGDGAYLGAEECSQTQAPAPPDETNDGRFPSGGEGEGLFPLDEYKPKRQHDQEAA